MTVAGKQCTKNSATHKSPQTDEDIFLRFGSLFCSTHLLKLTTASKNADVRTRLKALTVLDDIVYFQINSKFRESQPVASAPKIAVAPVVPVVPTFEEVMEGLTAFRVFLNQEQQDVFDQTLVRLHEIQRKAELERGNVL